jgi:CheY-like chemotaxis protein
MPRRLSLIWLPEIWLPDRNRKTPAIRNAVCQHGRPHFFLRSSNGDIENSRNHQKRQSNITHPVQRIRKHAMNIVSPSNSQNDIEIAEGLRRCKGDNAYGKANAEKRFLLVDDSIEVRFSVRRVLRSAGVTKIDVAENGEAALEMIAQASRKQTPYDVIILDYMMPGMSGIETLYEIRRRGLKNTEGTRKILLTGFYNSAVNAEAKSVGATFVLSKPCDAASLSAAIA